MDRVVGVDVSKGQLDAYDLGAGRRLAVANDAAGIARLTAWASSGTLVVMEASGGYERLAHRHLLERGLKVAIVNAKRVRDCARASGRLAKTDRVDAEVIARYGAFARPPATPAADAAGRELAELLAFRQRLIGETRPGSSSSGISRRPCSGGARTPISSGCGATRPRSRRCYAASSAARPASPAASPCSPACRGSV